jgi:hypothetical protein
METLKINVSEIISFKSCPKPKKIFIVPNIFPTYLPILVRNFVWPLAQANAPGRVVKSITFAYPLAFLS